GNILRNLAPQAHARIENSTHGVGIFVEADTAVTGNVVENATVAGIMAGWGRFLRDVTVTGNVVRKAPIGIGVSVTSGAGAALVANNMISGATRGAILGMEQMNPVTGDLTKESAVRYSQLVVSGNRVN
ncbi:MAG TPA: TIGR03808 family TAT-translocated repetitive protein, partial [Xanthobacteraceae bacterium]|nr:TIGR03808 family TAT-translocated repetitive protein [Xanthobacteraceae bacterium]